VAGKVLTTKLMKPQTNGRTPACPVCGNKAPERYRAVPEVQRPAGGIRSAKLDGDGNPVQSFAKIS